MSGCPTLFSISEELLLAAIESGEARRALPLSELNIVSLSHNISLISEPDSSLRLTQQEARPLSFPHVLLLRRASPRVASFVLLVGDKISVVIMNG